MPIRVKLDLIPEEAEALRDFAQAQADLIRAGRTSEVPTHLWRALTYLHGACAHQVARYLPPPVEPHKRRGLYT